MTHSFSKLMLRPGVTYGITINPEQQYDELISTETFPLSYTNHIQYFLSLQNIFPTLTIYPEYSPSLETNGRVNVPRLHWHGTCTVDPFVYYTYGLKKLGKKAHIAIRELPKDKMSYVVKNKDVMILFLKKFSFKYQITYDSIKSLKSKIKSWNLRRIGIK